MMKEQLLVILLTVGVFSHTATGQHANMVGEPGVAEDKCTYEDDLFNVDDIVFFSENGCSKLVCRANNVIEEVRPLGQFAARCCVCHNKLYLKVSETCKILEETEICPVPCKEGDKEYAHGDVVETILENCSRKRCLNGKITMEQTHGKGLTGCCLENNKFGKNNMVAPGTVVENGGCVPETCVNSNWVPHSTSIINTCVKCRCINDPHCVDFAGVYFDWHVGCNHAMVQEGTSVNPEFGVFMDFDKISSIANVGGPTTYQEDRNTEVVLHPGKTEVTVNGHTQEITNTNPTFLVGPGGAKTTVMAWKNGACIRLYGKPKMLVELCATSINIWAAKWSVGQKGLAGLCGSTDEDALKESKLVDRQGKKFSNARNFTPFGYSWQAAKQTKADCPKPGGPAVGRTGLRKFVKLDAREGLAKKWMKAAHQTMAGPTAAGRAVRRKLKNKRKVCEDVSNSNFMPQCLEVVKGAGLTGDIRDNLLKACLFDLCIVSTDHEIGITVEEMLQQHQEIAAETKFQEDNTIEFVPNETKCPAEWSPVGTQCFQVHPFNESPSIDEARQNCINQGAILAQPRDINATKNFLRGALLTLPTTYKGVGTAWLVDGGEICRKPQGYLCETEPLACGDEDDECAWRAADGECKGNRDYMFNVCKASCKVPCDCDQPYTCTEVGGMCQPLSASCDAESDPTLCPGDNCTCCYVPDTCQDEPGRDCQGYAAMGYCEATQKFIMKAMKKYCSRFCGFCEPMY